MRRAPRRRYRSSIFQARDKERIASHRHLSKNYCIADKNINQMYGQLPLLLSRSPFRAIILAMTINDPQHPDHDPTYTFRWHSVSADSVLSLSLSLSQNLLVSPFPSTTPDFTTPKSRSPRSLFSSYPPNCSLSTTISNHPVCSVHPCRQLNPRFSASDSIFTKTPLERTLPPLPLPTSRLFQHLPPSNLLFLLLHHHHQPPSLILISNCVQPVPGTIRANQDLTSKLGDSGLCQNSGSGREEGAGGDD